MASARRSAGVAHSILIRSLPMAGVDLGRLRRSIRGIPKFVGQYRRFRWESLEAGLPVPAISDLFPIIGEDTEGAGGYDSQYLHQDLWAARRLYESAPAEHFDISSRVDGFITSAIVFCPVG